MKYIMCSRFFPKGHPKAGQPTFFVERILNSIHNGQMSLDNICHELKDFINDFELIANERQKYHTIRSGSRYKPGDMVSLRVWSDKPYRSKQVEFAQVEVKKTWEITISYGNYSIDTIQQGSFIPNCDLEKLANNDGLHVDDFWSWFNIHPKKQGEVFRGQIICWSDSVEYGKLELVTENESLQNQ